MNQITISPDVVVEIDGVRTTEAVGDRHCGACTLCCKLLPIREMKKPAGERCVHQRHKGCAIYSRRPTACRVWSCMWLIDKAAQSLRRPDRSHYVVDVWVDKIAIRNNESGDVMPVNVVQVWVDPAYPDAHRDPALRAYLDERGKKGVAALIRYDSAIGFVLFPPSMSSDNQWHEERSQTQCVEREDLPV